MSTKLIQALYAGISRRDWSDVEAAANRLRDEIDLTTRVLAGTGIGSLPNDYPLSELAQAELARLRRMETDLLSPEGGPGVEGVVANYRRIRRAAQDHRAALSPDATPQHDQEDGR